MVNLKRSHSGKGKKITFEAMKSGLLLNKVLTFVLFSSWQRERIGKYFPTQGILTADMLQELVDH